VYREVKGSVYSFLASICDGKSDFIWPLLCPLPPQHKTEIEKLKEVQKTGSKIGHCSITHEERLKKVTSFSLEKRRLKVRDH